MIKYSQKVSEKVEKKSPEEIINQQTWEVLQGVKEEYLTTAKSRPVKYRIPKIAGAGIIPSERRARIIEKLEELGALKIRRNESGARVGEKDRYHLYIKQPRFDQVYKKYEKLCENKDEPKNKIRPIQLDQQLRLIPDHQLGMLMEIAFSEKPKPKNISC